mgnify:CR=1 FL=1
MEARMSITSEFIALRVGSHRIAVAIEGPRDNALANAILMLPDLFRQLKDAGVTQVLAEGAAIRGPLSAAEWSLLVPKADEQLEAARQEALKLLPVRGQARIVGLDGLAAALGEIGKPSTDTDELD